MKGFERITRNIGPALLENIERPKAPALVERHGENAAVSPALLEKLLPSHSFEAIQEELQQLKNGRYRARDIAGDPKIGTRHIHDFVIDKATQETKLYVVDPEHALGDNKNRNPLGLPRRGDLRPKVCVLYGTRLQEGTATPDISIIRFLSSAVQDPHLLKPGPQLVIGEELLRTGDIPEILIGKENKMTFRLDLREGSALAQSQLSSTHDLENLLDGKTSSEMAEGQMKRYAIFMNYFARHLRGEKEGVEFKTFDETVQTD